MSYFDTMGFKQDTGRFFKLLDRIATALETLAEQKEEPPYYEEGDEVESPLAIERRKRGWPERSQTAKT